jgi:hypothetical protein
MHRQRREMSGQKNRRAKEKKHKNHFRTWLTARWNRLSALKDKSQQDTAEMVRFAKNGKLYLMRIQRNNPVANLP